MSQRTAINNGVKEYLLRLLQNHHVGAENFVQSCELEKAFGVGGTTLRQMVNKLRCEGQPICSDANGYFYAQTITEVELTSSQLLSRIKKIINAVYGLILSQQNFRHELEEKTL